MYKKEHNKILTHHHPNGSHVYASFGIHGECRAQVPFIWLPKGELSDMGSALCMWAGNFLPYPYQSLQINNTLVTWRKMRFMYGPYMELYWIY